MSRKAFREIYYKQPDFQITKVVEELGELSVELCHVLCNRVAITDKQVLEEIADVKLRIKTLEAVLTKSDRDLIKDRVREKTRRLIERNGGEYTPRYEFDAKA